MEMNKITPIIVIGMNRSGTKWLSNILSNHPDVISVQHERARGILETNMFGYMQTKFDLSNPDDYVGFVELWSKTHFFKLSQADKEMFRNLNPRPNNYFKLFEILMEDYRKRNNKQYWLQKTSPLIAGKTTALEVMEYFGEGYFVGIKRDIVDTLKSTLQLQVNRGQKRSALYKATYRYVLEEKILKKCVKKGATYIRYEELIKNMDGEIKRICDDIGIKYDRKMLGVPFNRNTSFKNNKERNRIITKREETIIKAVSEILRVLPLFVMKWIFEMKNLLKGEPEPVHFISGTFGPLKDKYTNIAYNSADHKNHRIG